MSKHDDPSALDGEIATACGVFCVEGRTELGADEGGYRVEDARSTR